MRCQWNHPTVAEAAEQLTESGSYSGSDWELDAVKTEIYRFRNCVEPYKNSYVVIFYCTNYVMFYWGTF